MKPILIKGVTRRCERYGDTSCCLVNFDEKLWQPSCLNFTLTGICSIGVNLAIYMSMYHGAFHVLVSRINTFQQDSALACLYMASPNGARSLQRLQRINISSFGSRNISRGIFRSPSATVATASKHPRQTTAKGPRRRKARCRRKSTLRDYKTAIAHGTYFLYEHNLSLEHSLTVSSGQSDHHRCSARWNNN